MTYALTRIIMFEKAMLPAEVALLDVLCGLTVKFDFDKWPHIIFFFKKEKDEEGAICMMEYNQRTRKLWCRYSKIWSEDAIFKSKFLLNECDIQVLINKVAEKYFKMKDLRPSTKPILEITGSEEYFRKMDSPPPNIPSDISFFYGFF